MEISTRSIKRGSAQLSSTTDLPLHLLSIKNQILVSYLLARLIRGGLNQLFSPSQSPNIYPIILTLWDGPDQQTLLTINCPPDRIEILIHPVIEESSTRTSPPTINHLLNLLPIEKKTHIVYPPVHSLPHISSPILSQKILMVAQKARHPIR